MIWILTFTFQPKPNQMKCNYLRIAVYSIFFLLLSTQCSQQKDKVAAEMTTEAVAMSKDAVAEEMVSEAVSDPVPTDSKSSDTAVQRMLTKEGTLSWETNDINKTHAAIIEKAKKYNAYISSDNQTRNDYQISSSMQMRIPSDQFDAFISSVEKEVSRFDEKRIEVTDVTEEYIDVAARMKTKKELEQHYYELLKQTKNVAEILQVEAQLNIVRADIESAEGRLKYLKDKVNMSTLNLTFYETTSAPVGFFGEIGKSFVSGWKGFLYFLLGIISAWPIVLVGSFFLFWLIRRRRKNKN